MPGSTRSRRKIFWSPRQESNLSNRLRRPRPGSTRTRREPCRDNFWSSCQESNLNHRLRTPQPGDPPGQEVCGGRERSRTPHALGVHTAFEAGLAPSQFLFRSLVPREGIEPPAKSTGLQPAAPPWCFPGMGLESLRVRVGIRNRRSPSARRRARVTRSSWATRSALARTCPVRRTGPTTRASRKHFAHERSSRSSGPPRYRSELSAFSEQRYHLISLRAVIEEGRGLEPHAVARAHRVPSDLCASQNCLP